MAHAPESDPIAPAIEGWYYCVRCAKAWPTAAWQAAGWACPSTADSPWPEEHPHLGWSYVAVALGVPEPVEGVQYLLDAAAIIAHR